MSQPESAEARIGRRTATLLIVGLVALLSIVVGVLVFVWLGTREEPVVPAALLAGGPSLNGVIRPEEPGPFRPRGGIVLGTQAYFADSDGGRVVTFDLAKGRGLLLSLPLPSGGGGRVAPKPQSLAALPGGNLLVTDLANGVLWVLRQDGAPEGEFPPTEERRRSALSRPVGVAVGKDEVYVTDVSDHLVKVFSHSGKFLRSFGGEGTDVGRFAFPNGIALGTDGLLYVADSNNRRVQVLTTTGRVEEVIGHFGSARFALPRAVAFDRLGQLHVVDTMDGKVYVFDRARLPAYEYGADESSAAVIDLPEGIAIGEDHIVLANAGSRLLADFSY